MCPPNHTAKAWFSWVSTQVALCHLCNLHPPSSVYCQKTRNKFIAPYNKQTKKISQVEKANLRVGQFILFSSPTAPPCTSQGLRGTEGNGAAKLPLASSLSPAAARCSLKTKSGLGHCALKALNSCTSKPCLSGLNWSSPNLFHHRVSFWGAPASQNSVKDNCEINHWAAEYRKIIPSKPRPFCSHVLLRE